MADDAVPSTSSDSPSTSIFAVGNNPEKIKYIVTQHLERNEMRKAFFSMSNGMNNEEVTCIEVACILRKLPDKEREKCLVALVDMQEKAPKKKTNLAQMDRIIMNVILYVFNEGLIELTLTCQLLVTTLDLKMNTPINPKKISFIKENLAKLDYKGIRDLLKSLLVEKMSSAANHMPLMLSEYQRKQLLPVEDLIIDLIDRKKNYCPALFIITEISRIQQNSSVHLLPRVSMKIREVVASFRPLAEIGSMLGRTWMYPIWGFTTFSLNTNNPQPNVWKLLENTYRLHFKTHLPFRTENTTAQTYIQYILLKQPRGQENLQFLIRSQTTQSDRGSSSKIQCDEIIQTLILEAMYAMEDADTPSSDPLNQYNWLHLSHLTTFALCCSHATFAELLSMLKIQLNNYQYRKGRGELMWLVLQYVAFATGSSTFNDDSIIHDIFNILYPDELQMVVCNTESLNMVRFFAPAAIWTILSGSRQGDAEKLAPPEKIVPHMNFLQEQLSTGKPLEGGILAAIANAYSNNAEVFDTHVGQTLLKMLGATGSDQPPMHPWHLPHGRKSEMCLVPLDMTLLDSMTIYVKKHLAKTFFNHAHACVSKRIMPSPALIESLARILLTSDALEGTGGRIFAAGTFFNRPPTSIEWLSLCADLITYRLKAAPCSLVSHGAFKSTYQLLTNAYDYLSMNATSTGINVQLYYAMEQMFIRLIMITPPNDMIYVFHVLCTVGRSQGASSKLFNITTHPSKFGRDNTNEALYVSPEVARFLILNYYRSFKVSGTDQADILSSPLAKIYKFPASALKWFPQSIQEKFTVDEGLPPGTIEQLHEAAFGRDIFYQPVEQYFRQPDRLPIVLIAVYRCLVEYEHPNFQMTAYMILNGMNAMELIQNINAFVDYIIWKSNACGSDDQLMELVTVVYNMIFHYQFIPLDRFISAMVLHPNDDHSIKIAIVLLNQLAIRSPQQNQQSQQNPLVRRIGLYSTFPTLHANSSHVKAEDFFKKMSEYYREFPEYTYTELQRRAQSNDGSRDFVEPEQHLPVYYGNMMERLIPIVDVLLQRALEVGVDEGTLSGLLSTFSPLYKFHPQPLSFLYKTLFSLDGIITHTPAARRLVMDIVGKIDAPVPHEERNQRNTLLSSEFIMHNHSSTPLVDVCQTLIDRIVTASTYTHQPPGFAARDWRFSEYPPAAQALTTACIELMASPHASTAIAKALVEVSQKRPLKRPYDTMNAIGVLLTSLPASFQNVFVDELVATFDWPVFKGADPALVFESYNQELFLYTDNRILSMLALTHVFIQHSSYTLNPEILPSKMQPRMAEKVENEAQLLYFLRIMVPYLQKLSEKSKQHMHEASSNFKYMKEIGQIYELLARLVENGVHFVYEDTICDLLYQFKYMFVGYYIKDVVEQSSKKFTSTMREKLRFMLTYSTQPQPDARSHSLARESSLSVEQMMLMRQAKNQERQQQQQTAAASATATSSDQAASVPVSAAGTPMNETGPSGLGIPTSESGGMDVKPPMPASGMPPVAAATPTSMDPSNQPMFNPQQQHGMDPQAMAARGMPGMQPQFGGMPMQPGLAPPPPYTQPMPMSMAGMGQQVPNTSGSMLSAALSGPSSTGITSAMPMMPQHMAQSRMMHPGMPPVTMQQHYQHAGFPPGGHPQQMMMYPGGAGMPPGGMQPMPGGMPQHPGMQMPMRFGPGGPHGYPPGMHPGQRM